MDFNSFLRTLPGGSRPDPVSQQSSEATGLPDARSILLHTPAAEALPGQPAPQESSLATGSSQSLEQRLAGGANRSASNALAAAAGKFPAQGPEAAPGGRALDSSSPAMTINLDERQQGETLSQLEGITITHYVTEPSEELRKFIAVNNEFITYGLKAGQIRVLHRVSAARKLLKSHQSQLTDLRFFNSQHNQLASASAEGRVIVWRLSVQQGAEGDEVVAEQLLSLLFQDVADNGIQLAWHPQWAELLAIAAGSQVLECSLPAIMELEPAETVCVTSQPPPGTAAVPFSNTQPATAIAFSLDGTRLAAGRDDGNVMVAAVSSLAKLSEADILAVAYVGAAVNSLTWLSDSTLLVGSSSNADLQTWRLDPELGFQLQHKLSLQTSQPVLNNLAFDPNHGIVLLANARGRSITALHVAPSLDSFDAFAQFALTMPILSLEARSSVQNGADSGGAVQIFTVQTQAVQQYSLKTIQCLPAEVESPTGAAVERSSPPAKTLSPSEALEATSTFDSPTQQIGNRGMGGILTQQDAATSAVPTDAAEPSGLVPIAVPPPPPSPSAQPHLLTPSQLMQAAKAALPRSVSGSSSIHEIDAQPRAPRALAGANFQQRYSSFQHASPPLLSMAQVQGSDSTLPSAFQRRLSGSAHEPVLQSQLEQPSSAMETPGNGADVMLSSQGPEVADSTASQPEQVTAVPEASSSSPPVETMEAVRSALQGVHEGDMPKARLYIVSPSPLAGPVADQQAAPEISSLGELFEKIQRGQKEVVQQLVFTQQSTVRALKGEMRKETKRLETASEAQIAKLVKSQLKTIAEERKTLIAEERQNLEKLLVAISSSINRDLPQRIEDILKREVSGVTSAVGSAVQAALAEALPRELASGTLQASLERALAAQLKLALAKPLQEGFRTSFQQQVLPAFEAACQNMFAQVQATFAGGLAEHLEAAGGANAAVMSSLKDAVAQVNAAAVKLSDEMSSGYRQLLEATSQGGGTAKEEVAPPVDHKAEILRHLEARRYEEAFNAALDLGDISFVAWLCGQVEPQEVLASTPPLLSQQVLLVLLQQLGYDLSTDTGIKVLWIKEIAVELDPHQELLAPHMHNILQAVLDNLRQHRFEGKDAKLARFAIAVLESAVKQCIPYGV